MQETTRARAEQALVVLVGVLLTAFVAGASYVEADRTTRRDFADQADGVVEAILDEIGLGVTAAEATRGLIVAAEDLTDEEFAEFVDLLGVGERLPDLSAVVLTIVIDAEDTDAFEDRISRMVGTPFTIMPREPHGDQRWIVTFIEPMEGNEAAVGADLWTNPVAREAGLRAVEQLSPTMSGPLELGGALGGQSGLGVVVPVLGNNGPALAVPGGAAPIDADSRRDQLVAFTAVFFRGDDLLHTVLDQQTGLAVSVRDRAVPAEEDAVVGSFIPAGSAVDEAARTVEVDVDVFGRPWTVTVAAVRPQPVPLALPAALAVAGLLLTLVLALLLGGVRSSERRAQAIADAATADLARANAALEQANEDLARANEDLARANEDLADSNVNLQRSNLELSRFAHVASHDLKQPVQLILSFTELLEDLLTGRLGAEGLVELERTALAKIGQGASRMRTLIDDFLALAGADRGPETIGRVEVTDAVQQVLDMLMPQIEQIGASVEVATTDPVIMDPRQLVPLLQNLVDNALKFKRPDAVPTVRISAVDRGRDWVLEVTDNGIGIAEEDRAGVFETFRRLNAHDTHEGSGVGLAICAAIVEGHGGTIQVRDGIDGGSRFVVRLPQPPQAPRTDGGDIARGITSSVG
ncbi:MAG TPA: ATP-binding protein [Euzebya sp.]|nr:ATP-binding protein [Euzebya sp.]